jgi:hypothetical protein
VFIILWIFIIITSILLLYFNYLLFALSLLTISIGFSKIFSLIEKHLDYFEWEEESDPIFSDYHQDNKSKISYKVAIFIHNKFLSSDLI